jgi:hypothetical protein
MQQGIYRSIKNKMGLHSRNGPLFMWTRYSQTFTREIMVNLSVHHDIEVINEKHYFQELKWKIMIPEINSVFRETSLHNFYILKDQILLNQHNPLYNTKVTESQKIEIKSDKNEEVRKELIYSLQVIA